MIQYLRYNESMLKTGRYECYTGGDAVRFFLKQFFYLFMFIYSTFFLAVAVPFVQTPFEPIYFIGAMASTILLIRIVNHLILFFRYKNGHIAVTDSAIEVQDSLSRYSIPLHSVTYLEYNFLGNLVIRQKDDALSFPVTLLSEDDRDSLFNSFEDMGVNRTALLRQVWDFLDAVVVALVLAVHIIQFVVQAYFIPTGSMKDTLLVGDHLFVEKITYGPVIPEMAFMEGPVRIEPLALREVRRGDIVIFRPPHEPDKDYIKRCIATPGDRFEIKDGAVYINGERQEEPYVKGITTYDNFDSRMKDELEGIVPEGKLVVMGDNRMNSQDSRYFGYLDLHRVKGRAFVLYWNWERIKNGDFSRLGLIR